MRFHPQDPGLIVSLPQPVSWPVTSVVVGESSPKVLTLPVATRLLKAQPFELANNEGEVFSVLVLAAGATIVPGALSRTHSLLVVKGLAPAPGPLQDESRAPNRRNANR